MDIEIAKEILKGIDIKFFLNGMTEQSNYIVDKADEINIAIDTVLSELENKDKVFSRVGDNKFKIFKGLPFNAVNAVLELAKVFILIPNQATA